MRIKIVRQAVTFIANAEFVDTIDNMILDIDSACAVFRGISDKLVQHQADRLNPGGGHFTFITPHLNWRPQNSG
jgi:hypothetical protein